MPASWVQDESIWEDAKDAFKESYPGGKGAEEKYAIITDIYKNMGGKIKSKSSLYRDIIKLSRKAVKNNDFSVARASHLLFTIAKEDEYKK